LSLQQLNHPNRRSNSPPARVWMIIVGLAITIFLLLLTGVLLFLGRRRHPPAPLPAVLEIIPARTNVPDPTSVSGGLPIGSAIVPPAQHGVGLVVGAHVQVTGTGGDGLRLRDQPGLNGNVFLVASEAEVFRLEDGPVEMDGYTWWLLVGPFDETRRGWGVANYLEIIKNP
jgi:hypothetical protein